MMLTIIEKCRCPVWGDLLLYKRIGAQKFKLQYSSHTTRYLHFVKNVDTSTIGTLIKTPNTKISPDPPIPLRLDPKIISHVKEQIFVSIHSFYPLAAGGGQ